MRKKYLSALLFGALLFASAGTFTSCKDYDDDINNLQGQITANADAIKALQNIVNAGKYVTAVSGDGNTITFTFNDGTTTPITVENGEASQALTIDAETGELLNNGEPTGIKPATDPEKASIIMGEDGCWQTLQEDGTYKTTGIPVSGVSVVGDKTTGWTLTIVDAKGDKQEVTVPSAISSITDLIVIDKENVLEYAVYTYVRNVAPTDWKGPRTLPSEDTNIISTVKSPVIQINPTTISPIDDEITFSLVDSKNNIPTNVNLIPENYTELITRAANPNGLYALSMEEVNLSATALATFNNQFKDEKSKLYAVTAGSDVRSEYQIEVNKADAVTLKTFTIKNENGTAVAGVKDKVINFTSVGDASAPDGKIDVNDWHYVTVDEAAALYDMHLSVSNDDKTLFGIEIEESADGVYKFRATNTPDNITKAGFELTIQTIDKFGVKREATVWLGETKIITSGYKYEETAYQIKNETAGKNYFSIDLSEMKNHLGEQGVALWNTQVAKYSMNIYKADDMSKAIATNGDGIEPVFTKKVENNAKEAAYKEATNIVFKIDNEKAGDKNEGKFKVNTHYVAVITFKTASGEVLNTINVPFIFSIPAIDTLFEVDPGFVKEGVASCYLYSDDAKATGDEAAATFKLNRIFSKLQTTGYTVTLDDKTVVTDNKKSAELAYLGSEGTSVSITDETYVTLKGDLGKEVGYNQPLNLVISGAYADAWTYPENEVFTFKVRIMSPIEQGSIVPAEGSVVSIPASELDGYHFNNDVITGYTYNNQVSYKVLPVWRNGESVYSRADILKVKGESGNSLYFTVENGGVPVDAEAPTKVGTTETPNDGYFLLKGYNVDHTVQTVIKIKVTDIWNRVLSAEVPVEITVE